MNLYWTFWFFAGFGIPEAIGLATGHPQWTLSWFVWNLFGVGQDQWNPTRWTFAHYLLAVLMVWLVGHFVFKLWRG